MQQFLDYLRINAGVTEEQIKLLAHRVQSRRFEKGEFLLDRGQVLKCTYFVGEGLLRFYSIGNDGKEHIVQFVPENWFVSDRTSMCFDEPSEYFIDAFENSTVAIIDQSFVNYAEEISPEFRMYNERLLQNHIRQLQKRISLLIGASAEERYLDFMKTYPDLTQRVPQWMIASYLGITPEGLSRVRKELSRKHS